MARSPEKVVPASYIIKFHTDFVKYLISVLQQHIKRCALLLNVNHSSFLMFIILFFFFFFFFTCAVRSGRGVLFLFQSPPRKYRRVCLYSVRFLFYNICINPRSFLYTQWRRRRNCRDASIRLVLLFNHSLMDRMISKSDCVAHSLAGEVTQFNGLFVSLYYDLIFLCTHLIV